MKLRIAILATSIVGTAWAQNPSIIDSTRAKLNNVQQQQTAASNAALAATQGQSAPAAAPQKPTPAQPQTASKPVQPQSTAKTAQPQTTAKPAANSAPAPAPTSAKKQQISIVPANATQAKSTNKAAAKTATPAKPVAVSKPAEKKPEGSKSEVAVVDSKNPDAKKDDQKTINMAGRRDPFISPVVNHMTGGSGCNTGKRCLAVDQIALTGVVKSDTGMIAVVVNAMNKAYFLRENDPVFNGYVVKITGDSIVFKETIEDKLGKPFTREVTKKIYTPAV
jgi:hypothetical protein